MTENVRVHVRVFAYASFDSPVDMSPMFTQVLTAELKLKASTLQEAPELSCAAKLTVNDL